jgi:hypothetical protein
MSKSNLLHQTQACIYIHGGWMLFTHFLCTSLHPSQNKGSASLSTFCKLTSNGIQISENLITLDDALTEYLVKHAKLVQK